MLTVGESNVEVAALWAVVKGVDEVMLRKRRLLERRVEVVADLGGEGVVVRGRGSREEERWV